MHIRPDDATLHASFATISSVVAMALKHSAQRLRFRAEEGAAAVVLETDQRARAEALDLGLNDDVADEAPLPRLRPHIDEPDPVVALAVGGLVVVAEQLVAAADSQDLRSVSNRTLQRRLRT